MMIYTEELFSTGNDDDNRAAVNAVAADDLNLVGVAVYGPRNPIDKVFRAPRCTRNGPDRAGWLDGGMNLDLRPALLHPELLAKPVAVALAEWVGPAGGAGPAGGLGGVEVAAIDPELADTAAFCEHYDIPLEESANCVVIAAKRGGETTFAACLVTAVTRADVNGVVRRRLGARKASFAPMGDALAATGMEYGGITPIGLPPDWPVLIDGAVVRQPHVIIGSGIRGSKLRLPGALLARVPGAEVIEGLATGSPSPRRSAWAYPSR